MQTQDWSWAKKQLNFMLTSMLSTSIENMETYDERSADLIKACFDTSNGWGIDQSQSQDSSALTALEQQLSAAIDECINKLKQAYNEDDLYRFGLHRQIRDKQTTYDVQLEGFLKLYRYVYEVKMQSTPLLRFLCDDCARGWCNFFGNSFTSPRPNAPTVGKDSPRVSHSKNGFPGAQAFAQVVTSVNPYFI
jgi:hypothetical protein